MTTIHDVDTRKWTHKWTQPSNARATVHCVATVRGFAAESDSVGALGHVERPEFREYPGHREYRRVGAAAEPKSVIKALVLIIGAVVVVGAGAVAGAATLATPLPAHPVVVPAALASPVAARSLRSSVIINTPKPKPTYPPGTPAK
jgi:hypothetical protein